MDFPIDSMVDLSSSFCKRSPEGMAPEPFVPWAVGIRGQGELPRAGLGPGGLLPMQRSGVTE